MSQPPIPENPENPPAPPPPSPAPPHQGSPAPTPPRTPDGNPFNAEQAFRTLTDTLNALPEKLVNGVREAGQAAPPAPVVNTPEAAKDTKNEGGTKLAKWWFGR